MGRDDHPAFDSEVELDGSSLEGVLYLRNTGLKLHRLGQLDAQAARAVDDGCKASCVDWYGNARPIFSGNRILALLGYELVEGRMGRGGIHETDRVNYAPVRGMPARRR